MESQPQNPEFRIHPENFHPCNILYAGFQVGPTFPYFFDLLLLFPTFS